MQLARCSGNTFDDYKFIKGEKNKKTTTRLEIPRQLTVASVFFRWFRLVNWNVSKMFSW